MLISLMTNCLPLSFARTSKALPKDPSPIFLTLEYFSIEPILQMSLSENRGVQVKPVDFDLTVNQIQWFSMSEIFSWSHKGLRFLGAVKKRKTANYFMLELQFDICPPCKCISLHRIQEKLPNHLMVLRSFTNPPYLLRSLSAACTSSLLKSFKEGATHS